MVVNLETPGVPDEQGLPTVLEGQEDEAGDKDTPDETASSDDLTTAVLDQVQCLQWEEEVENEIEETENQESAEGEAMEISKEDKKRIQAGMAQHKDLPPNHSAKAVPDLQHQ